eukprot:6603821-Alexandrium_andersonii.AAC.1
MFSRAIPALREQLLGRVPRLHGELVDWFLGLLQRPRVCCNRVRYRVLLDGATVRATHLPTTSHL